MARRTRSSGVRHWPAWFRRTCRWTAAACLFADTVVLRTGIDGDLDFHAVLRAVRDTANRTREHEQYRFDLLVDDLGAERTPGRNPLFDVFVETVLTGPPAFHAGDQVARLE